MNRRTFLIAVALILGVAASIVPAAAQDNAPKKLKVLILDGQNNHNWKATTPVLKWALESSDRFTVDVSTAPAKGDAQEKWDAWRPAFGEYDAVLSNYNGSQWPQPVREALVDYVSKGGGFVVVHAANNAFADWPEYNRMIGVGGWGGRNPKSGPYIRFKDGKFVRVQEDGRSGSHGRQHEFVVTIRDAEHPITRGLPTEWLHAKDEPYDSLRGPAENVQVLATAYSSKETGGSGEHEPMIMVIPYGQGRVFHTPMGHGDYTMKGVGFITVLRRGTEWAATGKVTQAEVPEDFPTKEKATSREMGKGN